MASSVLPIHWRKGAEVVQEDWTEKTFYRKVSEILRDLESYRTEKGWEGGSVQKKGQRSRAIN